MHCLATQTSLWVPHCSWPVVVIYHPLVLHQHFFPHHWSPATSSLPFLPGWFTEKQFLWAHWLHRTNSHLSQQPISYWEKLKAYRVHGSPDEFPPPTSEHLCRMWLACWKNKCRMLLVGECFLLLLCHSLLTRQDAPVFSPPKFDSCACLGR